MRRSTRDLDSYTGRIGFPRQALRKDDSEYSSGKLAQSLTRLEVASAAEIRGIVYFFHSVIAAALVWTIFALVFENGLFTGKRDVPILADVLNEERVNAAISAGIVDEFGIVEVKMRDKIQTFGRAYPMQMIALSLFGTLILFVLGVLFLIRLAQTPTEHLTPEQLFACGLLFASLLHVNFVIGIYRVRLNFMVNKLGDINLEAPFQAIQTGIYGPALLLHAWCVLHYYRILDSPLLDEKKPALPKFFFVVKIGLLLPYSVLRIVSMMVFNFWPSDIPLMSAIGWMYTFWDLHPWRAYSKQGYMVVSISLYEAVIVFMLIREFRLTVRTLREAPYLQYRTKQTGFRFFSYIGSLFFLIYFVLTFALIIGRPRGNILTRLVWAEILDLQVIWNHKTGPTLLLLGYVVVTVFVNLPSDSIGTFTGWYRASEPARSSSRFRRKPSSRSQSESSGALSSSTDARTTSTSNTTTTTMRFSEMKRSFTDITAESSSLSRSTLFGPLGSDKRYWFSVDHDYELEQQIVEPVTYRHRESVGWLELHANCFTMQTHIILFNFAWYVYYYGTPKEGRLRGQDVMPFKFRVTAAINEPETDTQVLVIDGSDRIIVSFKGSTSLRNLRTSLAGHRRRLSKVVPTASEDTRESEAIRWHKLFGATYSSACVHAGFAHAYASVAVRVLAAVRTCLERESRPVMLCGHSLGGALATICSLDIWGTLRLSRRHILVSTYGSPRVGNESFQKLYDSAVPLHWVS